MRCWITIALLLGACRSDGTKKGEPTKVVAAASNVKPTIKKSIALPAGARSRFTKIAAKPDGGFCAVGFFEGAIDLAGTKLTAKGSGYSRSDGMVACFDANGDARWLRALSSVGGDWIKGLAIDRNGDVVIVGSFGLTDDGTPGITADLAGTTIAPVGQNRQVIARLGADGAVRWARVVGSGSIAGDAIALTASGQIVMCGKFYDAIEFAGTRTNTRSGGFVATLSKDGEPASIIPFTASESVGVETILIGADDTIHAVGYYTGDLAVAGKTFAGVGGRSDGFVVALGPDGKLRWQRTIGTQGEDLVLGIASDGDQGLLIAGSFGGALEIAGTTKTAKGQTDAYVAALAADGTPRWFTSVGADDRDDYRSVALTPGGIVAVGAISENFKTETVKELPGVPVTVLGKMQGGMTGFSRAGAEAWFVSFASPDDIGMIDDVAVHGDTVFAAGAVNGSAVIELMTP